MDERRGTESQQRDAEAIEDAREAVEVLEAVGMSHRGLDDARSRALRGYRSEEGDVEELSWSITRAPQTGPSYRMDVLLRPDGERQPAYRCPEAKRIEP